MAVSQAADSSSGLATGPPIIMPRAASVTTMRPALDRAHRTLTITRKGGKVVTIPLAPRTARSIDLAAGERTDGPVFLSDDGQRLDRHGAGRIMRRVGRRGDREGRHVAHVQACVSYRQFRCRS